jgi:hypothetical protein
MGLWTLWRLSRRQAAWLIAFPLLFLAFISNTVAASRYLNVVLPLMALLAAVGVNDLAVRLKSRYRTAMVAGIALAAALPGLVESRWLGAFFGETDTRTLAQEFIERNVPPESTVLVQPYSVQLVQSRDGLVESLTARLGDPSRASTKFALRLQLHPWPAPAYRTLYLGEGGLDADKIYVGYGEFAGARAEMTFRRLGVSHVVLKRFPVDDPAVEPLQRALERRGHLIARFSPYAREADVRGAAQPFLHNTDTPVDPALARPGPIVEVWAIR